MMKDRTDYMRAYYQTHKEEIKAKRKPQPRTTAQIDAEKRYRAKQREKRRILSEIAAMPVRTIEEA